MLKMSLLALPSSCLQREVPLPHVTKALSPLPLAVLVMWPQSLTPYHRMSLERPSQVGHMLYPHPAVRQCSVAYAVRLNRGNVTQDTGQKFTWFPELGM